MIRSEAKLAQLLYASGQDSAALELVLLPNEADAQKFETALRQLSHPLLSKNDIVYMPGFVQSGVFRFESARRVIARRLGALHKMQRHCPRFIVTSVCGLLRMVPTRQWLESSSISVKLGQDLDLDYVLLRLQEMGYSETQRVEEVGEYAVRGAIVDFWTPGEKTPSRIEFFGELVDKIRMFRAADQRSYENRDAIDILPAREFCWPQGAQLDAAIERFNDALLGNQVSGSVRFDLLENLRHGVPFAGIDDVAQKFAPGNYVPFVELVAALAKDCSRDLRLRVINETQSVLNSAREIHKLYSEAHSASFGKAYLSLPPSEVFPKLDDFITQVAEARPFVRDVAAFYVSKEPARFDLPSKVGASLEGKKLRKISERAQWLAEVKGSDEVRNVLLLCRSSDAFNELVGIVAKYFPEIGNVEHVEVASFSARDLFNEALSAANIGGCFFAALADTSELLYLPHSRTLVVSQSWLQGTAKDEALDTYSDEETESASRAASEALLAAQFADFIEGEFVVHVHHGIAIYRGIASIAVAGINTDFLVLEYAGSDKIYIPIHKMHLVQKYMGAGKSDVSVLDSLRGGQWEKRKAKAKEDAEKLARELMEHKAKHTAALGHAFTKIGEEYLEFEAAFPYDETPDQTRAIREIMSDMSKPKAMDRILCGDVGFGKTEVAMRAAYRAVLDGKQVAWLVPTTILAHQHFRSLLERFRSFSVRVEALDRVLSVKSASKLVEDLAAGKVDIVVGTHRLLSKDIRFRDLGLLIVDEEHRFGVMQKEKIKTLSYGIDELAMTATPIPRTLQMAMLGIRELSLLATPPKARLAVKTFVCPFDENVIRDSITAELNRGGQVFYVHNRVEELASVHEFLKGLLPQVRFAIGHGKMSQRELEKIMIDFLDNKYDVLLCTTIIESGIDMPNVNTIIVQNSDHFGLSQLYQLRGRVGRRSTRGFAYFLSSPTAKENDDGMRRLEIIKDHQELGSGFVIASHDLELRGAGNVLGDEQSGHVNDVGLETYLQMLDDAVKSLGGVKVKPSTEVEIQIPLVTQIPESYIENSRERLKVYRRFFGARSEEALQSLLLECEDRFGPVPESVGNLAEFARMRRWLVLIGAVSLNVTPELTEVRLSREILQPVEHDEGAEALVKRILDVCNRYSKGMRITPDGRLLVSIKRKMFDANQQGALAELKRYLSMLAGETYGANA